MGDNKDIITLGEWNVPSKWEDIDLRTYQEIERYYDGKDVQFDIRDVLHILTNHSKDEINMLPMDFLERIMGNLAFLQESPKDEEPKNWIEIDGERYTVHTEQQLKTGEYISADTLLKGDPHNYAALLAILCRKDGELYDSRFENEVLEERVRLFEKQPITKVMPIIGFFLQLYMIYMSPILLSSKVREAIDFTAANIQNLQKSGEASKRSMKSAMKKLRKLEKSINSI